MMSQTNDSICYPHTSSRFQDFELKTKFFAATDRAEIELPKLSRESELRPALIEVDEQLQTNHAPNIRQRNISANRLEPHVCVKRKELPVFDKAIERITVEVIAVGRIGGPIRIRIVRRDDQNAAAGLSNAMKLGDESHDIGNVFGDV